jgi:hypothetical protein
MKKYFFATLLVLGILTVSGYLKVGVSSNGSVEEIKELDSLVDSTELSVVVVETNWCGWCDGKFQNEVNQRGVKGYKLSAENLQSDSIEKYGLTVPAVYLAGEGKLVKID